MKCPKCGSLDTKYYNSGYGESGSLLVCKKCGCVF